MQNDLILDYRSNVVLYPKHNSYLLELFTTFIHHKQRINDYENEKYF